MQVTIANITKLTVLVLVLYVAAITIEFIACRLDKGSKLCHICSYVVLVLTVPVNICNFYTMIPAGHISTITVYRFAINVMCCMAGFFITLLIHRTINDFESEIYMYEFPWEEKFNQIKQHFVDKKQLTATSVKSLDLTTFQSQEIENLKKKYDKENLNLDEIFEAFGKL